MAGVAAGLPGGWGPSGKGGSLPLQSEQGCETGGRYTPAGPNTCLRFNIFTPDLFK